MQQRPNMLLAFLSELLQRFFTKSPKFFRIWQAVSAGAAILTGLPEFLLLFNITLHAPWDVLTNKFIAAVSTGMFIMSALTTQSKVVGTDTNTGQVVKQTDEKALPFTAAVEDKASAKGKQP